MPNNPPKRIGVEVVLAVLSNDESLEGIEQKIGAIRERAARIAVLEAENVRLRERDAAEANEMISWIESLEYSRPFETRQAQIGVLAAVVEELRSRYLNEGGTR